MISDSDATWIESEVAAAVAPGVEGLERAWAALLGTHSRQCVPANGAAMQGASEGASHE
jgi:hypothetical protein